MILLSKIAEQPLTAVEIPQDTSPEVIASFSRFNTLLNQNESWFFQTREVDILGMTVETRSDEHGIEAAKLATQLYQIKRDETPKDTLDYERYDYRFRVSQGISSVSAALDKVFAKEE